MITLALHDTYCSAEKALMAGMFINRTGCMFFVLIIVTFLKTGIIMRDNKKFNLFIG